MEYKIILGIIAVLLVVVSYGIYFKKIISGKTKPHAFTWFIWGLATGIVFLAQISEQGGAGAWVTGFTSIASFVIFALALLKGDKKFIKLDWIFLGAAMFSLLLWWLTSDPTLSVILLTIVDTIGVLPTLRKSYYKPDEESATFFSLSSIKFIFAIFALESLSLATWLYPATLIITNALVAIVILIRRKQLKDLEVVV